MNRGDIDLWVVRTVVTQANVRDFHAACSADERQRADTFRFPEHRKSFLTGRGLLRNILAAYTGYDAAQIHFQYTAKGKPFLPSPISILSFNLAHSGDCAVYAIGRDCEIGVDIECIRDLPDAQSIARRFFSPAECEDLLSLAADIQPKAFFSCWTRKEACLKALGEGLSFPLHRFRVSLLPGCPPQVLSIDDDQYRTLGWTLFHLEPAAGYVGALAALLPRCTLHERKFASVDDCLAHLSRREPAEYL